MEAHLSIEVAGLVGGHHSVAGGHIRVSYSKPVYRLVGLVARAQGYWCSDLHWSVRGGHRLVHTWKHLDHWGRCSDVMPPCLL